MMRIAMNRARTAMVFVLLGAAGLGGSAPTAISVARAAPPPKAKISEEASSAIAQMEKSLRAERFSFRVRTLRVYPGAHGQPLHVAHSMEVTIRRPDRMRVDVTGDDGSVRMLYDGKVVTVYGVETNKYATAPVPDTIQGMLDTVAERLNVDLPIADFLTASADKSVLVGVTSGEEVNTVTIDGVECRHLLFTEPPGVDIELWVEKNDQALPRRMITTYHTMPGQPNVIAEFSDWNFSVNPSDADFQFEPPKDATQVELTPASIGVPTRQKGARP